MAIVSFVGAGPGETDLITLKGYKLLAAADVVIYAGSLINKDLLNYCKADAEKYDSAKMTLDDIVDRMEEAVNDGKSVVRLQTGDFSIYGSIREQIEEMKNGVLSINAFLVLVHSLVRRQAWAWNIRFPK